MSRLLTLAALVLALTVAACGGNAAEDRAQDKVCDARADIQKQVDALASTTLSSGALAGIQTNLQAIQKDVEKIAGQQSKLGDERRADVKQATQAFTTQVQDVTKALVSGLASGGGQAELKSALQDLAAGYKSAFAPVKCD